MREVTYEEFRKLPEGTIFCYQNQEYVWTGPCRFGKLDFHVSEVSEHEDDTIVNVLYFCPQRNSRCRLAVEAVYLSYYRTCRVLCVYEQADIDDMLGLLGLPPAGMIHDLLKDSEGITAQVEYRRGKHEGATAEREACAVIADEYARENQDLAASQRGQTDQVLSVVQSNAARKVARAIRNRQGKK